MSWIDVMMYIGYALLIGCAVAALVLPLVRLSNPRSLVMVGISVAAILVIFGLGYVLSSGEVTPLYARYNVDAGLSKIVGATLFTFYVLAGIAVVTIVVAEVSDIAK